MSTAGSPEGGPQERGDPGEAAGGDGGLQGPGGPAPGARGGYCRLTSTGVRLKGIN